MRIQQLLHSLNDKNIQGLNEDEIVLWSQLTNEELKELAAYRNQTKRTILHRILSTDRVVPSQNEVFWTNVKKIFQAIKDKLIEQDSERLTHRILLNHNTANVRKMITTAHEVGLVSYFSEPKTMATYLSSSEYDTRKSLCQAKGLPALSADQVIKLNQGPKNLKAELDSARSVRSHAMNEVASLTRQINPLKSALQVAKKERDKAREHHGTVQQKLEAMESFLSQGEEEKHQQQQRIQALQTRVNDLEKALKQANKKARTLETELHTSLREISQLETTNRELMSEYSQVRRYSDRAQEQLSKIPEVMGLVQLAMQGLHEVNGTPTELPDEDSPDSSQPGVETHASPSIASSSAGMFSRKRTAQEAGLPSSSEKERRPNNPPRF
ncbi:hypothetical protein [Legionella yabuuchiae]|uniref:hypothetical protein n=1 Tax=Legionella yabuuchiae TaxID=376727 RepID=UPI001054BE21|nr:hypothetical protein [Legionella yabuuchiae]